MWHTSLGSSVVVLFAALSCRFCHTLLSAVWKAVYLFVCVFLDVWGFEATTSPKMGGAFPLCSFCSQLSCLCSVKEGHCQSRQVIQLMTFFVKFEFWTGWFCSKDKTDVCFSSRLCMHQAMDETADIYINILFPCVRVPQCFFVSLSALLTLSFEPSPAERACPKPLSLPKSIS